MSSLNQLISEIAHSVGQADSVPARRAIRRGIIHARNELIRKSYANHNYTDKALMQSYKVSLINVPEADLPDAIIHEEGKADRGIGLREIKRSRGKVPRPVRLTNGLPFHSVRTAGVTSVIDIPFVRQGVAKYYKHLPGISCFPTYDFINGFLYITGLNPTIENIIIESVFEYPHYINESTHDIIKQPPFSDDDEFLLPEDMIGDIKKLIIETFNPNISRETNEVTDSNLVK